MRTTKLAILALLSIIPLLLSGCGSSRDSGGNLTDTGSGSTIATAQAVGVDNCVTCHANYPQVATWIDSTNPHTNPGSHIQYDTSGNLPDPACAQCHDQTGDGLRLPNTAFALSSTSTPTLAQATTLRPVIGCESCHGGGQFHRGVGPIPYPTPDFERCGQCHDQQWAAIPAAAGHAGYHPEGNNLLTDYKASAHATSRNSHVFVTGSTTDVKAPCGRCHTDEGGKLYKAVNTVQTLANVQTVANASAVQCRTCHDAHNPGKLLMAADTGPGTNSAEYNTCINCHQGATAAPLDGSANDNPAYGTYSDTADLQTQLIYHANRYDHVITFNHEDDPTTDVIEGFVVDKANARSCRDCHNVHAADISINAQWAESGHAGKIAVIKDNAATAFEAANPTLKTTTAETAVVKMAGVDPNSTDPALAAFAAPLAHYNWDKTNDTTPGDRTGRAACQRCHTSTGAKNYFNSFAVLVDNDPTNDGTYVPYDPANNDFSYLDQWTATNGSGQNEMIYCWACHKDNSGALRKPGPITADYNEPSATSPSTTQATFPDLSDSNVCVACHEGRENGQNIKDNFATTLNAKSFGSDNSHYLSAAGTIFKKTGYEFATLDYTNSAAYEHDLIGQASPETGTHGPCASCHMQDDSATGKANHLYTPFKIDATTGAPIDDTPGDLCTICHNGVEEPLWTPTLFAAKADGFAEAITALTDVLATNGVYYDSTQYPYFYTDAGFTTQKASWASEQLLGAAFNLNLMNREPGAFAHNSDYARRLLFDAIDWMDNGVLDGTIDLTAYPAAADWYQEDGITTNDNLVARP